MTSYEENYLSQRPQNLCKMCGKCCRVVISSTPFKTIKSLAISGDKSAKDFLSIFVPYESISEARAVDASIVDNIIKRLKEDGNYKKEEITFYYCKYLKENNLCGCYENRPDLCIHFPSTPWANVPPGCGFEGWLFARREQIKENIRRSKEELLELKLLKTKPMPDNILKKIELVEQKINRNIQLYAKYGSEDW